MNKDQCWWITGASSGIGEGIAKALSAREARLVLSGRNEAELARVAQDCGAERCLILPFEATEFAALPDIVSRAMVWAGRIDGLVNNAGISQRSLALETRFSVYQRMIDVDLLGPIALTQSVLPQMVAAGGGQIVAISSVAGIVGSPMRSAYSAAKHGLIGYHDSIRVETAHLGIKVLVVSPGSIRTNVSRNALLADGSARGVSDAAIEKGMAVEAAADAILKAIEEGKGELIFAEGVEAQIVHLRRSDPEALFVMMAGMMANGYANRMKGDRSGQEE